MATVKKRGGARKGAGRKKKVDEVTIITKLAPMADSAFKAVKDGLKAQDFRYVKMYFEYMYGKPQEKVDHTTNGKDIAPSSGVTMADILAAKKIKKSEGE